ncbi:DUF2961 domain-containing protein [Tahibacter sp. UC22_41]|uniref:DUF2961 domain-containing protein n=1 Tax=Tahibacter sp. UC22_41 TaxID=3350178 RepID=UPI0036DA4941
MTLLAAIWAVDGAAQPLPWDVAASPAVLARLPPDVQVLERSSHCSGGCRYDRDGRGPELPADNPQSDRSLYRGDGNEQIVFDERGPGAVTRIWMTSGFGVSSCLDPAIRVRFYVDGAVAPTLDLPLPQLFDGSTAPFVPALVRDRSGSSGGFVSYVPIAYARSLRIALSDVTGTFNPCTGNGEHLLWYQFTHQRLAPDAAVTGFSPQAHFGALANWFAAQGGDPWNAGLPLPTTTVHVAPAGGVVLAARSGSGWLRGLRLELPRTEWKHLRLQIAIDGEEAVDLPLERFFATAADAAVPARAPLLGEDAGGWLYSWLPMPYRESLQVRLRGSPSQVATVAVNAALVIDAAAVPADAGQFFAASAEGCGNDQVSLLQRRGAGRVVGLSAQFRSAAGPTLGYLEGDERIHLDGATAPQWYGTGLEDFFNGGFYFDQGAFATPWAGATRLDADGTQATHVWRWMATDGPSWQNAIDWRHESGFAPDLPAPMCHASVVYGYARAQPALVPYLRVAAVDAAHELPPDSRCGTVVGLYPDEPPTAHATDDCRYAAGSSYLRLRPQASALPLRLRRIVHADAPSAPADILLDGVVVGHLSYLPATPRRAWAEQDAVLAITATAAEYRLQIRPRFDAPGGATGFGVARWELWGGWVDRIFADGLQMP